jgi:hypothetical protein
MCANHFLFPRKSQQFTVNFLGVCPDYTVRPVLYLCVSASFDGFMQTSSRSIDGQNPVGITLDYECGHINTRKILSEIG